MHYLAEPGLAATHAFALISTILAMPIAAIGWFGRRSPCDT